MGPGGRAGSRSLRAPGDATGRRSTRHSPWRTRRHYATCAPMSVPEQVSFRFPRGRRAASVRIDPCRSMLTNPGRNLLRAKFGLGPAQHLVPNSVEVRPTLSGAGQHLPNCCHMCSDQMPRTPGHRWPNSTSVGPIVVAKSDQTRRMPGQIWPNHVNFGPTVVAIPAEFDRCCSKSGQI